MKNGNDAFGFSVLPGGYRNSDGLSGGSGKVAYFYSSTTGYYANPIRRVTSYSSDYIHKGVLQMDWAFSVHCIKA